MAPYTIRTLMDQPIVLILLFDDYSIQQHQAAATQELRALLDASTEPMHLIISLDEFKFSLEDMIFGTNTAVRGADGIAKHPHLAQIVMVSTNKLWQAAAKGMQTAAFGSISISAVSTLEEALAQVSVTTK